MSNIETIPYPDQFREEVRKRIVAVLQPSPVSVGGGGGGENIETIATNIEKGLFNCI